MERTGSATAGIPGLLRADVLVGAVRQEVLPLGAREVAAGDPAREAHPCLQVRRPHGGIRRVVHDQITVRGELRCRDHARFDGEGVPDTLA